MYGMPSIPRKDPQPLTIIPARRDCGARLASIKDTGQAKKTGEAGLGMAQPFVLSPHRAFVHAGVMAINPIGSEPNGTAVISRVNAGSVEPPCFDNDADKVAGVQKKGTDPTPPKKRTFVSRPRRSSQFHTE